MAEDTVFQMIKKLTDKGLVIKNVSSKTDNEVVLSLTERGREFFNEHKRYHESLNGSHKEQDKRFGLKKMNLVWFIFLGLCLATKLYKIQQKEFKFKRSLQCVRKIDK